MFDGAVVAVVVPAHNEQRWLAEVFDTMPRFVDHIVVVDDGSWDATAELVTARARVSVLPHISFLRHQQNRGVGAAIVSGYRLACEQGAEVIAVMAGDGQMHPDDLAAVVQPVVDGRADYVKGNRFRYPAAWRTMPVTRMAGSFLLSCLTSLATGVRVSDSQCGYTAVSAAALERVNITSVWPRYGYPNDLIGTFALAGLRIHEVVVRPVYRGEHSGLRPWHLISISLVIARLAARRVMRRYATV